MPHLQNFSDYALEGIITISIINKFVLCDHESTKGTPFLLALLYIYLENFYIMWLPHVRTVLILYQHFWSMYIRMHKCVYTCTYVPIIKIIILYMGHKINNMHVVLDMCSWSLDHNNYYYICMSIDNDALPIMCTVPTCTCAHTYRGKTSLCITTIRMQMHVHVRFNTKQYNYVR